MIRRPPSSPLFPSTPLSRSRAFPGARQCARHDTVFVAADAGPVTDGTGRCPLTAGVSAGIDMALTLLGRIHGRQLAQMVQLAVEYDPRPPLDAGSPSKAPAR